LPREKYTLESILPKIFFSAYSKNEGYHIDPDALTALEIASVLYKL